MKKQKQTLILSVLTIVIVLLTNQYVFAKSGIDVDKYLMKVNYSEKYINWTNLSATQKNTSIQPKVYDDINTIFINNNPFYEANLLNASMKTKYNLKDVIPNNVVIRNQYNTQMCWAFSGLSSLETNLALKNKRNEINLDKVYDYSERHINYSTTRSFLNGKINEFGYNRTPDVGGQWLLFESYLTTGQGAIEEVEMPFENNSNILDISQIQNKEVKTRLYDTVYFNNYNEFSGTERQNEINKIKQHIQDYGSVFAAIHGNSSNIDAFNCYDNETGAKYCNNPILHPIDHAVSIVGWDDSYSADKFVGSTKPSSNGAWIVRNSWGEKIEYEVIELKEAIFESYPNECREKGWNTPEQIPNKFLTDAGYEIVGDKLYIPFGDNGFIYVSYEDCNVGESLYGIVKAVDEVDYNNIYQYDELCAVNQISFKGNSTYLSNVFDKKTNKNEYITGISIVSPETYTCKVYVNPNGTSKAKEDLEFVKLVSGDSETIDKGYHTLEFMKPVLITGTQFTVVVEITGTRDNLDILLEGKIDGIDLLKYVKTENDKCFVATTNDLETCSWIDLGKLENSSSLTNGDTSIKAFTVINEEENLERIEIDTPPTKTSYIEGENFDKSGMKIKAIYKNKAERILNDTEYTIVNGIDLKLDQKFIKIEYMNKVVDLPITVVKKEDNQPEENKPEENKPEENKPDDNKQDDNPEIKDEYPIVSNFSNAKCKILNIKAYSYETEPKKDYSLIKAQITNITRNLNNDSYKYYYYISSNSDLSGIKNWIEIKEEQTTSDKLEFTIDTRDVLYYEEKVKSEKLYIYIREEVNKSSNQSVAFSKAINFEKDNSTVIETFMNDEKKEIPNIPSQTQDNNKKPRRWSNIK